MRTSRLEYQREWQKNNKDKLRAYSKKWRDAHREYNIGRQRQYQLKYNYNFTEEQYQTLLISQKYRCAICETDTPTGKWKVFAIDHCHTTKEVRGLLCNECNRGMGLLKDSEIILEKALIYLKNHKRKTRDEKDG